MNNRDCGAAQRTDTAAQLALAPTGMMPPDSVRIVVHAFCHLNDDERPLKGWDQAPLDRSLSSEIMGETVPNVPQCLLVEHDRLLGLFRLDLVELLQMGLSLVSPQRDEVLVGPSRAYERGVIADNTPR